MPAHTTTRPLALGLTRHREPNGSDHQSKAQHTSCLKMGARNKLLHMDGCSPPGRISPRNGESSCGVSSLQKIEGEWGGGRGEREKNKMMPASQHKTQSGDETRDTHHTTQKGTCSRSEGQSIGPGQQGSPTRTGCATRAIKAQGWVPMPRELPSEACEVRGRATRRGTTTPPRHHSTLGAEHGSSSCENSTRAPRFSNDDGAARDGARKEARTPGEENISFREAGHHLKKISPKRDRRSSSAFV